MKNISNYIRAIIYKSTRSLVRVLRLSIFLFIFSFIIILVGCARMGNLLPDGGWYDEDPPKVLSSLPENGAVNFEKKKINILFDEYIKIENATENVIISPPQIEQADIKTKGKSIAIELKDTLKENTTYTIDFSDAIVDNNESNPLGNYTFIFSTGSEIDTMQVAGYVLDAQTLEPVSGILVGLYEYNDQKEPEPYIIKKDSVSYVEVNDSVNHDSIMIDSTYFRRHSDFMKYPMLRVSRTDQNGHFSIKGVKIGSYHIYALQDVDNNFMYTKGSGETLAYNEDIIVPSVFDDNRQDTLWLDSLRIQDISLVPYKHFMPDNVVLRAFTPIRTERAYLKYERKDADNFSLFFTYGDSILPDIRGLNFNADNAFILEKSLKNDTLTYWIKDTSVINIDSLEIEMKYRATDTLGVLQNKVDTLMLIPKLSYEKRKHEQENKFEAWKKKQNKLKKRGEPYDSIMPLPNLEVAYNINQKLDPDKNPYMEFKTPLASVDTSKIHLYYEKDSLWYDAKWKLQNKPNTYRTLEIISDWMPEVKYSLEIDSVAFTDIYGHQSKPNKAGIQVKGLNEFGTFTMNMPSLNGKNAICQLVDSSDKLIKEVVTDDGNAKFLYLSEKSYYLRVIIDSNGNGVWDTGDFEKDIQPEEVYYYNKEIKVRAKWDLSETWDPYSTKLNNQKPGSLRKTKSSTKKRTLNNKNINRAQQLGIELPEYLNKRRTVSN